MGFFSALQDMSRKKQDYGMPYSIVMLLRSPFAMSEEVLSRAASKAYRVPYDGFSLLQVFDSQTGGLVSPQSASQEKSQQGTITFAFHPCVVRTLPQRTGLLIGQPVSHPHAILLQTLHTPNPGSQIGAEQTAICGLVGQPPNGT